jgi:2-oxoglutarate ferredoxin oxidoreductase subunit gamma
MHEEIIFSGFGGQGVLLMGKLLAQASMSNGQHVTWMPSYGAEVRGGTAHSMVVVSDKRIPSPVVVKPTACIAMNEPSMVKFEPKLAPGGLLILNSTLIKRKPARKDIKVLSLPLTETADLLGNTKVSNMIALGAYNAKRKIVPLSILIKSLKYIMPVHRHNMLEINEKALRRGAELTRTVPW